VRAVDVYSIVVLDWRSGDLPEIDLAIRCGAGTYIRSIARDLGAAVGAGATLAALCRTASSGFRLEDSLTLEQVATCVAADTLELVPPIAVLMDLEKIVLPDELARRWCFGQKIVVAGLQAIALQEGVAYRVHDHATQAFLGITKVESLESGWRLLPQMVYQTND
jgi:tRNA pseudouridine55 synthase